jgi:hypothetical protein
MSVGAGLSLLTICDEGVLLDMMGNFEITLWIYCHDLEGGSINEGIEYNCNV